MRRRRSIWGWAGWRRLQEFHQLGDHAVFRHQFALDSAEIALHLTHEAIEVKHTVFK